MFEHDSRFLKRDDFTCQYCGRKSPDVVLEVDHIVPQCDGGSDDVVNLRTSCWDCNRGKAGKPLDQLVTGEDPHDKAIELLERERQLREYHGVQTRIERRIRREYRVLDAHWPRMLNQNDRRWLRHALTKFPAIVIRKAMDAAIDARATHGLAYVNACLRNWKERGEI